jgi:hypothetical protein
MRKRIKRTKQTVQEPVIVNVYNAVPSDTARDAFIDRVSRTKDGANSYVTDFLQVVHSVKLFANSGSFNFDDFLLHSRRFEIPATELRRLFDLYTKTLCSLNKLVEHNGCYSESVFTFIG